MTCNESVKSHRDCIGDCFPVEIEAKIFFEEESKRRKTVKFIESSVANENTKCQKQPEKQESMRVSF